MNTKMKVVPTTDIEVCSACLSTELDNVFDMPALPHIGIYLDDKSKASNFPRVDNGLHICRNCGHVQLHKAVSPEFLYDETFTHRTSDSPTASAANLEYANYIKKLAGDRKFKRAIEVGCNDAFFLKSLAGVYDQACGVDPVWKNREHMFGDSLNETEKQSISVIGDFVENADFEARIGGAPDLITSSFVFEHIKEPVKVLQSLFSMCDDDALFVINVPGSDMLFNDARFDQLSHQHYQQFTLHSFIKMVEVAGGEYIDHNIYYSVWGAIMVAFKKRKSATFESAADKFRKADLALVQGSKQRFDALFDCSKQLLKQEGFMSFYQGCFPGLLR